MKIFFYVLGFVIKVVGILLVIGLDVLLVFLFKEKARSNYMLLGFEGKNENIRYINELKKVGFLGFHGAE